MVKVHQGPPLGEGVLGASLEELEAALQDQPEDLNWAWASRHVIPVMPRIRPYPAGFPEPLRTIVAPGIAVGFAIDVGPAFMGVGEDLIRSWGVSLADVHARSLANVVERAAAIAPSDIFEGGVGDAPTRWLQTGQSIGSVMVLVPDELGRLFGGGPAFFITPMRDLIIGQPADVDRELAAWLWLEVASLDPNCLGATGYRFDGHSVTPEPLDPDGHIALDAGSPPSTAYVA
jgi:hypothetical protein